MPRTHIVSQPPSREPGWANLPPFLFSPLPEPDVVARAVSVGMKEQAIPGEISITSVVFYFSLYLYTLVCLFPCGEQNGRDI